MHIKDWFYVEKISYFRMLALLFDYMISNSQAKGVIGSKMYT